MNNNRFLNNAIAIKLLRLFVQPWTDTEAFKTGVIDQNGKFLIPPQKQTITQKQSYDKLQVLVWNLKKIVEKFPLGKKTFAKYATALALIKEEVGCDINDLKPIFDKYITENIEAIDNVGQLFEDMGSGGMVGNVTTGMDIVDPVLGKKRPKITSPVEYKPDDHHANDPVFDVSDDALMKSRFGKRKYLKYSTYVGNGPDGEKVRAYARANPKKNIILRNNGSMMFLRRTPKNIGE